MSTETKFRITKKVCRCCGERKAVEEFYREAKRRDGRYSYCKLCSRLRAAESVRRGRSDSTAAARAKWAAIAAEAAASA